MHSLTNWSPTASKRRPQSKVITSCIGDMFRSAFEIAEEDENRGFALHWQGLQTLFVTAVYSIIGSSTSRSVNLTFRIRQQVYSTRLPEIWRGSEKLAASCICYRRPTVTATFYTSTARAWPFLACFLGANSYACVRRAGAKKQVLVANGFKAEQ